MRWIPSVRSDYQGMPVGQTTIPLLVTATYFFQNDSGVYPYLGASLGIALTRPHDQSPLLFQVASYFRPGVEFEISRIFSLTLEPRLGFLDNSFLFAPQVGLTMSL